MAVVVHNGCCHWSQIKQTSIEAKNVQKIWSSDKVETFLWLMKDDTQTGVSRRQKYWLNTIDENYPSKDQREKFACLWVNGNNKSKSYRSRKSIFCVEELHMSSTSNVSNFPTGTKQSQCWTSTSNDFRFSSIQMQFYSTSNQFYTAQVESTHHIACKRMAHVCTQCTTYNALQHNALHTMHYSTMHYTQCTTQKKLCSTQNTSSEITEPSKIPNMS